MVSETTLLAALGQVEEPYTGKDCARALHGLRVDGQGTAHVQLRLAWPAVSLHAQLRQQLEAAARRVPGINALHVDIAHDIRPHVVQRGLARLDGVKNIIAVFSGKGGVGKSTTTANLALALMLEGARVGVLDADIYGPSQPAMLGVPDAAPESLDGKSMEPLMGHGVQVASMGFLVRPEQAMIWRGPMATRALEQLLRQTRWKDLDYLLVDMPPGTGDIALTLAQRVPLVGALAVTTPQDIALLDVRKGVAMFEKVGVHILGLVENMAAHICPQCGHVEPVFGTDGGKALAQELGLAWLGELPLSIAIRQHADGGTPTVLAAPQSEAALIYREVARKMAARVATLPRDFSARMPPISVQPP